MGNFVSTISECCTKNKFFNHSSPSPCEIQEENEIKTHQSNNIHIFELQNTKMNNENQNMFINLNHPLDPIPENNMERSVETLNNITPKKRKESQKIIIQNQPDEEINLTNLNNDEYLQKVEIVKIKENNINSEEIEYRNNQNVQVKKFNGLENIGNSCYLNSILQIFIRMQGLFEYFWSIEDSLLKEDSLIKKLINFQRTYAEKEELIYPDEIQYQLETLDPKRFKKDQQADSYYLYTFLLNTLKKEIISSKIEYSGEKDSVGEQWDLFYSKNEKNFIVYLFYGTILTEMLCKCGAVREMTRNFNALEFIAPEEWNNNLNLSNLLELQFGKTKEYLQCRKCQVKNSEFDSVATIQRLPKFLLIRIDQAEKISVDINEIKNVNFDKYAHELDPNNRSFFLFGIIIFSNRHYTSIIKDNEEEDKWIMCDDKSVYLLSTIQLKGNQSYLLFYKNKNI